MSTVLLAGASPTGTAMATISIIYLGHEEDSQSAPLGTARHPERNRGARPFSLPVAQEQSWRLLNGLVAGASPAREISQVSK